MVCSILPVARFDGRKRDVAGRLRSEVGEGGRKGEEKAISAKLGAGFREGHNGHTITSSGNMTQ